MIASDIMTTNVVTVRSDTPVREIARTLLDHKISAVPVLDEAGRPIGIVSEGDLVSRSSSEQEQRRDWWLAMLAEGEHLNDEFMAYVRNDARAAINIMAAPVVTVSEDTDIAEIARLLSEYRIKRVPVLKHRRIVGIVSRADLIRAMSNGERAPKKAAAAPGAEEDKTLSPAQPAAAVSVAKKNGLTAIHFRELVADHDSEETLRRIEARRAEARRRHAEVSALIDHHIEDENWKVILHDAQAAAAHGDGEYMIMSFPSDLCRDGGRAINALEPDWPTTLRGEAAEIYLRWERDLKPASFHLAARVLNFPGGVPGDIGLFLIWGK